MKQMASNPSKIHRLVVYWRVWQIIASNALQEIFINRWTNALFTLGKVIRLVVSLTVLWLLKKNGVYIAGYSSDQAIIFFLTYQFIDLFGQVLFRGVYWFGNMIRNGELDFLLCRPINPLFQSLVGKPDLDDAFFLIPSTLVSIVIAAQLQIHITWQSFLLYLFLLANSMLFVTGFHILVLVFGILTTEVDNLIWTYRDVTRLGQFPITLYQEPLRTILFLVIPLGLMFTIPAQVLLAVPSTYGLFITCAVGIGFLSLSLWAWNWGLKQYSSASS